MRISLISIIILTLIILANTFEDPSSYSNFNEIQQKKLKINLNIDFENKRLFGFTIIEFEVLKDNANELILDSTNGLQIYKIVDEKSGLGLNFSFDKSFPVLGYGLKIQLHRRYKTGETLNIRIYYSTNQDSESLQWLTKEMTKNELPYLFTQNESIYARSMVPCQDTPAIKIKIDASLTAKKEFTVLFGGKKVGEIPNSNGTTTHLFKQDIDIPTYLIAIAAGKILGKEIEITDDEIKGKITMKIWADPNVIECAHATFKKDLPLFAKYANRYLFDYEWGTYDILVLPGAFPFGGMENPNLTFATPALLHCSYDKEHNLIVDTSQTSVAAHELAHSWTGNLVTNANWNNFWLNEGFTVFFERKIIQSSYNSLVAGSGDKFRLLNSQVNYYQLVEDIRRYIDGGQEYYTKLMLNIEKYHPDEAFSTIPYEKGYALLYYLENSVVKDQVKFREIVLAYIQKNKYKSVTYKDFQEVFINKVTELFADDNERKEQILKDFNSYEDWLKEEGEPKSFKNDFSNDLSKDVQTEYDKLITNKEFADDFKDKFNNWNSLQQQLFLSKLFKPDKDTDSEVIKNIKVLDYLKDSINLKDKDIFNMQIRFTWLLVELKNKRSDCVEFTKDFLSNIGRAWFVSQLFEYWHNFQPKESKDFFEKIKNTYHPMVVKKLYNEVFK